MAFFVQIPASPEISIPQQRMKVLVFHRHNLSTMAAMPLLAIISVGIVPRHLLHCFLDAGPHV